MHQSATLRDVAEACGVSIATVSAVVNGAPWVSDETRRRVQEAVDNLGYRPNQLARGLKTRRGYAVGVIVSDLTNPFFTEIVRGISHTLRRSEHNLLLCDSDHRLEIGDQNLRTLFEGHVVGVILVGDAVGDDTLRTCVRRQRRLPVIAIEREYDIDGVSCLLTDTEEGAYRVTRHFVEQELKRIAIIAGPCEGPGVTTYRRTQQIAGYTRALREAGRSIAPDLVAEGNFRYSGGREAMHHLLALPSRPDAVFASNDMMAFGARDAVREAGLRVPEDVALAGWDDIPLAPLVSPGLTTVAMPKEKLGEAAAELLARQIPLGGRHEAVRMTFPVEVVVRQSSKVIGDRRSTIGEHVTAYRPSSTAL